MAWQSIRGWIFLPFPLGFNILHDILSRAILHHFSAGVILSRCNSASAGKAGGWKRAQLHPGGRGELSTGTFSWDIMNWVSLPEQSDRTEGNLFLLGTQWADKREGTPQIAVLMVISIGCACTWDLAEEPWRDIYSHSRQLSSFFFLRLSFFFHCTFNLGQSRQTGELNISYFWFSSQGCPSALALVEQDVHLALVPSN